MLTIVLFLVGVVKELGGRLRGGRSGEDRTCRQQLISVINLGVAINRVPYRHAGGAAMVCLKFNIVFDPHSHRIWQLLCTLHCHPQTQIASRNPNIAVDGTQRVNFHAV